MALLYHEREEPDPLEVKQITFEADATSKSF